MAPGKVTRLTPEELADLTRLVASRQAWLLRVTAGDFQKDAAAKVGCAAKVLREWEISRRLPKTLRHQRGYYEYLTALRDKLGEVSLATAEKGEDKNDRRNRRGGQPRDRAGGTRPGGEAARDREVGRHQR